MRRTPFFRREGRDVADESILESGKPDHPDISDEERERILSLVQKMMAMGIGAVYGQEDEGLPTRPFFIARDAGGYCPHLQRDTLRCSVWAERPLRCRRYDCRENPQF
jgi:Fe-S-cluster containining protein